MDYQFAGTGTWLAMALMMLVVWATLIGLGAWLVHTSRARERHELHDRHRGAHARH